MNLSPLSRNQIYQVISSHLGSSVISTKYTVNVILYAKKHQLVAILKDLQVNTEDFSQYYFLDSKEFNKFLINNGDYFCRTIRCFLLELIQVRNVFSIKNSNHLPIRYDFMSVCGNHILGKCKNGDCPSIHSRFNFREEEIHRNIVNDAYHNLFKLSPDSHLVFISAYDRCDQLKKSYHFLRFFLPVEGDWSNNEANTFLPTMTNIGEAMPMTMIIEAQNLNLLLPPSIEFILVTSDNFAIELVRRCSLSGRKCRLIEPKK